MSDKLDSPEYQRVREQIAKLLFANASPAYHTDGCAGEMLADSILALPSILIKADNQDVPDSDNDINRWLEYHNEAGYRKSQQEIG